MDVDLGASEGRTRFCVNDGPSADPARWRAFVGDFLGEFLPVPSRWEI